MNTRTKSFLIAAALLTAPLLGHAGTDVAMDACVKAFISTSLEKDRPVTVRTQQYIPSPVEQHGRYRITLTAVGKVTGQRVAKATCVADRNGAVLSMNGKSIATLALAQPSTILSSR